MKVTLHKESVLFETEIAFCHKTHLLKFFFYNIS